MARKRKYRQHYDTPSKADLKSTHKERQQNSFHSPNGTKQTQRLLFQEKNVPRGSAYRIIKSIASRRHHNDSTSKDKRGRKSKLTDKDIHHAEMILWRCGHDGRVLTWEGLALEAGLDVLGRTL